MITLETVHSSASLTKVRILFREYAETRKNDPALEDFPEEIANLPREYGPPDGTIILAYWNGEPAGCVAVHRLEEGTCEMKRLFVSSRFQSSLTSRN